MEYYATVKHHSITANWEKLSAKTLLGAKKEAWKDYGSGYHGHRVFLVSRPIGDDTPLNDIPAWTREIAGGLTKWQAPHE